MALFPLSPLHSARMEFIQLLVPVLCSDWPSSILRVLIFIMPVSLLVTLFFFLLMVIQTAVHDCSIVWVCYYLGFVIIFLKKFIFSFRKDPVNINNVTKVSNKL